MLLLFQFKIFSLLHPTCKILATHDKLNSETGCEENSNFCQLLKRLSNRDNQFNTWFQKKKSIIYPVKDKMKCCRSILIFRINIMATFYFVKVVCFCVFHFLILDVINKLSHYEFNYGNTSQTTFYKKTKEQNTFYS